MHVLPDRRRPLRSGGLRTVVDGPMGRSGSRGRPVGRWRRDDPSPVPGGEPGGDHAASLDEEIRAIDAKIRGAEYRDRLELASHWAVRLDDLSGLLMRRRPDIVHFSGHGDPLGEIILLAADGTPKPVPAEALAGLFRVLKDNVRVVVFNACHSEAQAKAVVRVIDSAVGMSRAIDDDHAIAFAAEFYQALGFGRSVQDAYDLGVTRLTGEGVANAKGLVKLRKRRGINPADLVLVGDKHESNREPEVGAQPGRPAGQEASTPVSAPIKEEVRAVLRPLMPDRAGGRPASLAPSPPTPACSTASPTTVRPVSSCPR